MADKIPIQDGRPELLLNKGHDEVLRPPPRRKKSMKKTKIEAEKIMKRRINKSDADASIDRSANGKEQIDDEKPLNSAEKSPEESLGKALPMESRTNENGRSLDDSECEKHTSVEPKPTNEVQINKPKVEEQLKISIDTKITTKDSLSMDQNRNKLDLEESKHDMGNKSASQKSNGHNIAINSKSEDLQTCSQPTQGIDKDCTAVVEVKRKSDNESLNLESFCWVVKDNPSTSCQIDEGTLQYDPQSEVKTLNVARDVNIGKEISKQTATIPKNSNAGYNNDNLQSVLSRPDETDIISNESNTLIFPPAGGEMSMKNKELERRNQISTEIITTRMKTDSDVVQTNSTARTEKNSSEQEVNSDSHIHESSARISNTAIGGDKNDFVAKMPVTLVENDEVTKSKTVAENDLISSNPPSDACVDSEKENAVENIGLSCQNAPLNTTNKTDITKAATETLCKNGSANKRKQSRTEHALHEHMGDSLSSVEEYELWEQENIPSDSDSDIFYSDDYSSSSGDEGYYNTEMNESSCRVHNSDSDQGNSLPRSPSGESTINEILAVFPNTEYLSVADNKEESNQATGNHGDGSHDNKVLQKHNLNDLELSEERANSLRRKIGSFKVIPKLDPKVDTDVVKEAAVAIPTNSYKNTASVGINAEEAEKALQALHKNYLEQKNKQKNKQKKSTESDPGESSVLFSRVPTVQQDNRSDNSRTDRRLEISRPRSIHGEPRLRSLSTGNLNELHGRIKNRKYTIPVSTKSWMVENDKRLVNLDGELRYIIGSLGRLEISRDRRDSGSPMIKHKQEKEDGLDVVSAGGTVDAVGGVKNSCQEDDSEEITPALTNNATPNDTTSSFESSSTSLNTTLAVRPLSAVQEESSTIPVPNRTNCSSPTENQQTDLKNNTPEGIHEKHTMLSFKEEIKPVFTSTPTCTRPKSLEFSSDMDVFEEDSYSSSQNELSESENNASELSSKESIKKSAKNGNGEVETHKIKMSKGRRPFRAVEAGNIPTSPTETIVKLREFRSLGDSDLLDSGTSDNGSVEVGVEALEEVQATPQRPPRKKPPLHSSASFVIPSHEKPVKRVKKNRPEKSFRQTLSDADWLKVRLSMKPTFEWTHDGPITLVTDALPVSIPNFPTDKRAQIALELYTTERTYVRGLETIIELFKTPMEKHLDEKVLETMFSNINAIYNLNKDVLFTLCERVTHWKNDQLIGDIFVDMASRFKIYAAYCVNYDAAENSIKYMIKKNKEFATFLDDKCYKHQVCQPGLTLQAYLITVVQRIPRYLLLLRDLAKCTPTDHIDFKTIKEAIQKMDNIAEYINNQLQAVQGQRAMAELRSRVIGIKAFMTPGRSLIKEREVFWMNTKRTYNCLLFNDMIVFAARNVNKHSEVELTLELKTLWVCDLDDNDPQTSKEDALELYTPERSYTMYSGSRNEKKLWLQKIKTEIAIQLHGQDGTQASEISRRSASFTFKDGRIYCGWFVDSKAHGKGILAWPNRTRYEGNFEDGERNGIGELIYNTGEKYKGEWLDDKQHGVGTLTYPNGDVYCGQWKEGKMHGKGLITFSNNDKIEGWFVDNEVCGSAKLECENGMHYDGEWKHSKKHGKGKLVQPNGDSYEGEFYCDRIHGKGKMVYAKTQATYDGQWENNQRHGSGSFSIPNGAHYEGEWSSDHIQGRGKMVYGNGEVYEGSWFRDMRFGKGLFKSHEGTYDGHFEYNLRHKYGVMVYNNGSKYEGEWQNDQREGQGEMIYADFGIYEGSWFHNLRHGRGKMTYPNEATYEGTWDLDSPHGSDGVYVDQASNYWYKGDWVHGRKEGRGEEKNNSGTYNGDFKSNVRHGKGVETLKGGILFEGKWRDNRKVGEGQRTTKWGSTQTTEIQQWKEGQLLNKDESVAPDLPFLQRH